MTMNRFARPGKMPLEMIVKRRFVDFLLKVINLPAWILERSTRWLSRADEPSNILILRNAALGDFILSIPAMHILRATFPKAKLTLLTTASTDQKTLQTVQAYTRGQSPWLELLPTDLIDEIHVFPGRLSLGLIAGIKSNLREKNFDVCFILNEGFSLKLGGSLKKIVFLRLCGVGSQIFGIRTKAYPKVFPLAQVGKNRLEHHVLSLIRSIEECPRVASDELTLIRFDLTIPVDAYTWAGELLTSLGCNGKEIVIVAPGSRLEFKKWPEAAFGTLILELAKRPQAHIILVGTGQEAETVAKVRAVCSSSVDPNRLHDLSGKTSIPRLAALLSMSSVFVGNDGGTCHLAAAVSCKTVSIANGGEIVNSVEPWGNQRFTARFSPTCAPCYCFTFCPQGHRQCVVGIDAGTVLRLAEKALSEKEPFTHSFKA
jgi:heptosyltransferase-2